MATAAQLRARRLFAQRYGHRKRNPLTRKETGEVVKATRRQMQLARRPRSMVAYERQDPARVAAAKAYHFGYADALAATGRAFGTKKKGGTGGARFRKFYHSHRSAFNPEGGEHEHKRGHSTLLMLALFGGAFLLLRGGGLSGLPLIGGLLGGASGYTQVGTDASGHPIYQGVAGQPPPPGYVQTGTNAAGQPVYSYSSTSSILTAAGPLAGGVSAVIGGIAKLFGGGGSSPAPSAGPISGGPSILPPAVGVGVMTPQYDASGNIVGYFRLNSDQTVTAFDTSGNPVSTTSASGAVIATGPSGPDLNPVSPLSPSPDLLGWLTGSPSIPSLNLGVGTTFDEAIANLGTTFEGDVTGVIDGMTTFMG